MSASWFATWFNSPYYPLLYKHRDEQEAEAFMSRLLDFLALPAQSRLLDLACGRGRHALYMAKQGYKVLGIDLSPESIADAKKQEQQELELEFAVGDMREELPAGPFDAVLNLFTSFGYFESDAEQLQVLRNVHGILKPEGLLIIDFFNAPKVVAELVLEEKKSLDGGIAVELQRYIYNGFICKNIRIEDAGQVHRFEERVRAFDLEDWTKLLEEAGFALKRCFGNYALESYHPLDSKRLILIAEKQ